MATRGVLLVTLPEPVAQMVDHVGGAYRLTQEQVITAAMSALVGLLESQDARAVGFLRLCAEDARRTREAAFLAERVARVGP